MMSWSEKRRHPLYRRWTHARCVVSSVNSPDYKPNLDMDYYDDFEGFCAMIDQECGPRPSRDHLLSRKRLDLGYVHGNLEWQIRKIISHKLTTTVLIDYQGQRVDLKTLSDLTGIKYCTLRERYQRGWRDTDIYSIPPSIHNRIIKNYAKT